MAHMISPSMSFSTSLVLMPLVRSIFMFRVVCILVLLLRILMFVVVIALIFVLTRKRTDSLEAECRGVLCERTYYAMSGPGEIYQRTRQRPNRTATAKQAVSINRGFR